jgi:hypothetical protein
MAIQVNVQTNKDGLIIPSGLIIVYNTHFPTGTPQADENGNFNGVIKAKVTADLIPFTNKAVYQSSLGKNSLGYVDEVPTYYERELTADDYIALSGTNAFLTVSTWIKEFIETKVGAGNTSIVDLTII